VDGAKYNDTVPAYFKRISNEVSKKPGAGYRMALDTDREQLVGGRFKVVGMGKEKVSFQDAITGKLRTKEVDVLTVEQVGVF